MKTDPDWWKTLFDETYLITDARSVCDESITRREVDCFERLLALKPKERVLDFCGGEGRHSLELARRRYEKLFVLDYSPYLTARGRANTRRQRLNVCFTRADARCAGLKDASFDVVLILANSFGYFSEEKDNEKIISEAYRLLRKDGRLLIDITDASYVHSTFRPFSCHRANEECVVIRHRELKANRITTQEAVTSASKGLIRELSYSERLYDDAELEAMLKRACFCDVKFQRGFSSHDREGDYGFLNRRLLVIAKKG